MKPIPEFEQRMRTWVVAQGPGDDAAYAAFFAALTVNPSIESACRASGLSRSTVGRLQHQQPAFRDLVKDAIATGLGGLYAAAVARAVDGVGEPIYFQGQRVLDRFDASGAELERPMPASVRKYSDTLMIALLKRFDPEMKERTSNETTAVVSAPGDMTLAQRRAVMAAILAAHDTEAPAVDPLS